MNPITTTEALAASGYTAAANYGRTTQDAKAAKESQSADSSNVKKTTVTNGRTIGEPKLSEKAQKYYDQLRKKYSNMDFILVSSDMKQQAQANAGRFANPNRMVVLIDEEKIERMAEDEQYRKQYEGIISASATKMPQLANSIQKSANAGQIKGFGMEVKDGMTSFFAVIDKSLANQKDRITKKAQEKAETKKKDKKAEEKKRAEDKRTQKAEDEKKASMKEDENTVIVTASSIEELLQKINDTIFMQRSDSVRTPQELQYGQSFDFSI